MHALYFLIDSIIYLYIWLVIITVIFSWMFAFNLLNTQSAAIQTIRYALLRLTEPVLAPLRNFLPSLGGIDISPIILILLLAFIRNLLYELLYG